MKTFYEIKDMPAEVKDVDFKSRTVTGYFSKFGNIDYDGDMIMPGSFTKTIKERGTEGKNIIPHLSDHLMILDNVIGKPKLSEVQDGGFFETTITDTSKGIDRLKQYRDGLIDQHSFGFKTLSKKDKEGYKEISQVMLFEISSVVLGANENARFSGFKSLSKPDMLEKYNLLNKCYRNGDYSDDYFQILQEQIKQLEQELLEVFIKEQSQPITDTTKPVTPVTTQPEVKQFVMQLELSNFLTALKC